jgi:hypothetical protein
MIKNQVYILILFMFWLIASSWFYVIEIKAVYPDSYTISKKQYPVFFKYGDSKVKLGDDFISFKDFTLQKLTPNNRLLITGNYTLEEHNKTSHPNLGIARAENASILFADIDKSRIITNAELRDSSYNHDFIEARWLNTVNFRVLINDRFLKENAYGASLYLEEGINNLKIQAYLKYIAIENSDCQFNLMETINSEIDSISLNSISVKDQLILNGISTPQITVLPTQIDSTQNSYLEIFIIKSQSNEY